MAIISSLVPRVMLKGYLVLTVPTTLLLARECLIKSGSVEGAMGGGVRQRTFGLVSWLSPRSVVVARETSIALVT